VVGAFFDGELLGLDSMLKRWKTRPSFFRGHAKSLSSREMYLNLRRTNC